MKFKADFKQAKQHRHETLTEYAPLIFGKNKQNNTTQPWMRKDIHLVKNTALG